MLSFLLFVKRNRRTAIVMTESIQSIKADLRRTVREQLAAMSASQREQASAAIVQRLTQLDALAAASTAMFYMPIKSEVDVTDAVRWALQRGRTVCVPQTDPSTREMEPVVVADLDDAAMIFDEHGIRTPRNGWSVPQEQIDVAVVPGRAYTTTGHRLGRGAGYYDRFLKRLRPDAVVIGVGFEQQIVEEIPIDDHDVLMDVVVTDGRVSFGASPRDGR